MTPEEVGSPLPVASTTTPQPISQEDELNLPGKGVVVQTKNFYKSAQEITPQNDALLIENEEFQILYYVADTSFSITILATPINTIRQKAEAEFLKQLGVTKEKACQLKVSVGAPYWVDEVFDGGEMGLSFCK